MFFCSRDIQWHSCCGPPPNGLTSRKGDLNFWYILCDLQHKSFQLWGTIFSIWIDAKAGQNRVPVAPRGQFLRVAVGQIFCGELLAKLQFQCPAGASFYGKLCARWVISMMFELSLEVTIKVHPPEWLTTTTIMMIGIILISWSSWLYGYQEDHDDEYHCRSAPARLAWGPILMRAEDLLEWGLFQLTHHHHEAFSANTPSMTFSIKHTTIMKFFKPPDSDRVLQIAPSCHPGWENMKKGRKTWRTWKDGKTINQMT